MSFSLRDVMAERSTVLGRALGLLHPRRIRINVARVLGKPPMRFPTYSDQTRREVRAQQDEVRFASMALALKRLDEDQVEGAIAEVGVYRGTTSRFLSACSPNRPLHLFDSFEGFPVQDREPNAEGDERFRDTNEELVRRMVGERPGVSIHKGRFPDTTTGLEEERFAFVLLDLDLFAPTLAGLEFFYPRLARGAYVFVHDFNSPESNRACFRAVTKFIADKPEKFVELPDIFGSVVFRK